MSYQVINPQGYVVFHSKDYQRAINEFYKLRDSARMQGINSYYKLIQCY